MLAKRRDMKLLLARLTNSEEHPSSQYREDKGAT